MSALTITVRTKLRFWDVIAVALIVTNFVRFDRLAADKLFTDKWWLVVLGWLFHLGVAGLLWRFLSDSGAKEQDA